MSQSTLSELQHSGTIDAQPSTDPDPDRTDRTIVVGAATTGLSLESWKTFRAVAELTEDTLRRLA